MATIILTSSWLQLIDMALFTMYYLYVHKHFISLFLTQKDQVPVYCKRLCIIIVVYVFLLFVHVFLLLSMYTYCCLRILRRGYPD